MHEKETYIISATLMVHVGKQNSRNFVHKGMWVLFSLYFMFSNFYWLEKHNETSAALSKFIMKHQQKSGWILSLSYLVTVIESACLLILNLIEYVGPPNWVH